MSSPAQSGPASAATLARLTDGRNGMLRLHKALLDAERLRYERQHGRVDDGMPLLHLVSQDPEFAWLRAISMLIVEIDERMEADEPVSTPDVEAFLGRIRTLLFPDPNGNEFQLKYDRILQEDPDSMMLHITLLRAIR